MKALMLGIKLKEQIKTDQSMIRIPSTKNTTVKSLVSACNPDTFRKIIFRTCQL